MYVQGEVEIEDVTFSYPARPEVTVFSNLNLHVAAGETVALVGASGSGKSTIIQLLQRFYDPASGRIRVDGVDIRELSLEWYRNHVRKPQCTSGVVCSRWRITSVFPCRIRIHVHPLRAMCKAVIVWYISLAGVQECLYAALHRDAFIHSPRTVSSSRSVLVMQALVLFTSCCDCRWAW